MNPNNSPKERPILFSGPMVKAILEGKKTQTRRVVKLRHKFWKGLSLDGALFDPGFGDGAYLKVKGRDDTYHRLYCPHGNVGDRLWVRETFTCFTHGLPEYPDECDHIHGAAARAKYSDPTGIYSVEELAVVYKADGDSEPDRWEPGIHMPRWASRLLLEITAIRVERLNDISRHDAIAEGGPPSHRSIDRISAQFGYPDFSRSWFGQLWESINGEGSWKENPWVWVVEFKVLEVSRQ